MTLNFSDMKLKNHKSQSKRRVKYIYFFTHFKNNSPICFKVSHEGRITLPCSLLSWIKVLMDGYDYFEFFLRYHTIYSLHSFVIKLHNKWKKPYVWVARLSWIVNVLRYFVLPYNNNKLIVIIMTLMYKQAKLNHRN